MSEILNESNFDEVLKNNKNLVVDFFAEWCGPCKMLGPLIDEIAEEYQGQDVKIVKINIEESPSLAQKFNVMSVPTVIYFQSGEIKETTMGLTPKDQIKERIDNLLK